MGTQQIRWKQRFSHFEKAFEQLRRGVELAKTRSLSDLEKQGLIQAFEFTHELAWNVMKDFFEYQGTTNIMGSRDATREAFQKNLIVDGDGWMEMIKSRNQTTHTYNQEVAEEIVNKITASYFTLFLDFQKKAQELIGND